MAFQRILAPALVVLALAGARAAADAPADYEAGIDAYESGDYATAIREFEQLAARGVILAYTNLGYMHAHGEGVEADMAKSARWIERAARAGDPGSQLTLGVLFYNGEGVEQDLLRSFAWLSLAGAAGRQEALDYLEIVRARLDANERERAGALARRLLHDHGDPALKRLAEDGWRSERGQ